jgi:hypothetical protein
LKGSPLLTPLYAFEPETYALGLAVAAAVLVVFGRLLERRWPRARGPLTGLFVVVALCACVVYPNLGRMRSLGVVHPHEQFHFYLGSKYLPEVRYDGLYLATVAVEIERQGRVPARWKLRDLSTFEVHPAADVEAEATAVRARFTPERWGAFSDDVRVFERTLRAPTKGILSDHGNTGSPAWAMLAWLFTAHLPLSLSTANLLGSLDLVLLLVLFGAAWRVFGVRTAALTCILGLLAPRAWAYLGGSILRLDWLFALAMTTVMMGARRWRTAGLFLGYAIASKVFCGLVALAIGFNFLAAAARSRRIERDHARLVGFAFVGLASSVLVSSLVFGGVDIWRDYALRIVESLHEGYYRSQFSFRDVFLQLAHDPLAALSRPLPSVVRASLERVSIDQYAGGFLAARLLLVLGLGLVASRHDAVFASWIGALMIFAVLVTNIYYWQILLLLGLAAGRRDAPLRHTVYLVGGLLLLAVIQLPRINDWRASWHGYVGSYLLFWTCLLMMGVEAAAWWHGRRNRAPSLPKEAPLG